jgi:signal transduction histidine kinase
MLAKQPHEEDARTLAIEDTGSPERQQTDLSLRTEREKTDRALAERQAAIDETADATVQKARVVADAVLSAARDQADQRLDHAAQPDTVHDTLVQQRQAEDEALQTERAAADASLRSERRANARTLASLLPLEREKTDRYLLTERSRSDDELAHRDDFLGIVSHDLRNLLGGVVMDAELLSRLTTADEHRKMVVAATARIQRYAARMNRLVGDLVDVASMDAGKLAMTTAPEDAVALMAEAVEMFKAAAAGKGLELVLEGGERPLLAEFDRDRVLQVLANLITNAIKFTSPGGSIRLRGEQSGAGEEVRMFVRDSGAGIADDMLEVIFDRFWQVGKNDRSGLGLGLYISRSIVEAHGGRIWAESTPGAGSTLCFTLPGARSAPA